MPRNGSGVFSLPAVYLATTGNTITAIQHNSPLSDIAADLNAARPVTSGGTGATTASDARTNLGLRIGVNVQAFSTHLSTVATLDKTANNFVITNGTTFSVAAPATVLSTIGAAPSSRTISAAGLATGGGDLSGDRTITVPAASRTQAEAGTDNTTVMTPLRTQQAIDALIPVYSGSNADNTDFPVGTTVFVEGSDPQASRGSANVIRLSGSQGYTIGGTGAALVGLWRCRGWYHDSGSSSSAFGMFQRVA